MRDELNFRYFLAVRPEPELYPSFQRVCDALGLPSNLGILHLTLCVVGETAERDRFVTARVRRALANAELHSFAVNLSRVRSGPSGASAHPCGRQDELQDFFRRLVALLRACGIEPLHRKTGLRPHVTLAYRACQVSLLRIAIRWFPSELVLIESEVGRTRHTVLERWSLRPPRQLAFPFDDEPPTATARHRR